MRATEADDNSGGASVVQKKRRTLAARSITRKSGKADEQERDEDEDMPEWMKEALEVSCLLSYVLDTN